MFNIAGHGKFTLLAGLVFAYLCSPVGLSAQAERIKPSTKEQLGDVSSYRLMGDISYRKFIFHVYDAELRVSGDAFSWDQPYALTLTYARKISRKQLVDASISELARINKNSESQYEFLREPLTACFADVQAGDQITGHSLGEGRAAFYFNNQKTCDFDVVGASKMFFSIWLGENTLDPKKSRRLRGLKS